LALAIAVAHCTITGLPHDFVFLALPSVVTLGRWFLQRLATYYERSGRLSQIVLAWIYMGVVASALITELIGIHLISGHF